MEFEEWWAKQTANFDPEEIGLMQLARVTWHAAQEIEREACIAATVAERVDFEATGSDEDEVYNTALWHAVEAMQRRSNARYAV